MSQLACLCGHTISDTTDRLPYKAYFLPDIHDEAFFVAIADAAQSFVAAVAQNDREAWLKRQGFLDGYPSDLSHADVFGDFVTSLWLKYSRTCYECTACGRLCLQERGKSSAFVSFAPDSGTYEGILQSTKRTDA